MKNLRYKKACRVMRGMAGALLLMALIGCNTDKEFFNPDEGGGTSGSGGAGVENANLELIVSKKGSLLNSGTWTDGNSLGLFLTQGSLGRPYLNKPENYNNIKAYMYAGCWCLAPEEVELTGDEAVIFAYAPYMKNVDPFAIPIETESRTDYMYGTHLGTQSSVDRSSPVATLEMSHALSLLDLNVRKIFDFQSKAILEEITIEAANDSLKLPVKGTMDIMNGKITPTGYGKYTLQKLNQVLENDYTEAASYCLTMMPRENEEGEVFLTIVINGNRMSMPLHEDHDWRAGVRNVYNIVFDGKDLRLDQVEIKEWNEVHIEVEIEGR